MIEQKKYTQIQKLLPILRNAEPQMAQEFQKSAFLTKFVKGKDIFIEGDRVEGIGLLLSGTVRVYKIGETGREITLYRFGVGEGCILTASAILNDQSFPAIATVEEDAEVIMIPSKTFRDWIHRYPIWSEFVFNSLSQRLSSVMTIVDEVAFRRMDIRVANLLLSRSQNENSIRITHQEIAAELGSSREVISRILDDFSDSGILRLSRGSIEILEFDQLTSRTAM